MESERVSPEARPDYFTWEQYESSIASLIREHRGLHSGSRPDYISTSMRVPQTADSGADYYRYEFNERPYGNYLRITSGKTPQIDDNSILGKQWHEIDTSMITGGPEPGVNELVLKFFNSRSINGKRTKPVMVQLLNPSAKLLELKQYVAENEIAKLSARERSARTKSGEVVLINLTPAEITRSIDHQKGTPLKHWDPSQKINYAGRAMEAVLRAIKG